MVWRGFSLALLASPGIAFAAPPAAAIDPAYFEGRWSLLEESCTAATNWTMIAGGNFVSEDLSGSWEWSEGELLLRLEDLAIDEESGEAGGRFRMNGPVAIIDQDRFDFTIAPEIYQLRRCS
ncbi:hypothetical protein [Parasphingorhabdus sp.]|uniref:hypothetical protein n=1 Tax=Parasphingorhabdus sp. TaxID=2709688 RepID=UPI0035938391